SLEGELRIVTEVDSSQFDLYDPVAEAEILPTPEKQDVRDEAAASPDKEKVADQPEYSSVESTVEPGIHEELDDLTREGDSKRWLWPVIGVALAIIIAGIWFLKPMQSQVNLVVTSRND